MNNIYTHPTWWQNTDSTQPPEPPDMELIKRVETLEKKVDVIGEKLSRVETDVAVIRSNYATQADVTVIKSNYATKADVLEAKNSVIMWVVAAIFMAQLLPMMKDWVSASRGPSALPSAHPSLPPPSVKPVQ